jgi:transketolase C-terminal domain/subunit
LRQLAEKHGTLTVFVEGLTAAEVEPFVLKAGVLAKADAQEIAQARMMLDDVKAMKQTPKARATANELAQMIRQHRSEVLKMGATMRLIAEGLVEVRALEDAEALRKAKPDKDGIDVAANAAREETMARRLAGAEGLVVLILGGGHDLAAVLKRQAANVRYLRVATKAYREAGGE